MTADHVKQKKIKRRRAALAVAVLMAVLFFGLRPKGLRLDNAAAVLPDQNALVFGKLGIAYVENAIGILNTRDMNGLTIELALTGGHVPRRGFGTLLLLHDGKNSEQLIVGQYKDHLVLMNGDDYGYKQKRPRLVSKDVFSKNTARLFTITADAQGTRMYIDGAIVGTHRDWRLAIPQKGSKLRLVLGNSVRGSDSWVGRIHGIAIYQKALDPKSVDAHFEHWSNTRRFPLDSAGAMLAGYTFNEAHGRSVPDLSGRNPPLQLPRYPVVLKKNFLKPPWRNFEPNRSFFIDAALNLIGFIPLGAALLGCYWKSLLKPSKRQAVAVIAFCFLLSLSIEMLQAWMPTRSSSLMDLVLNTLGAGFGVSIVAHLSKSPRAMNFISLMGLV